jgi:RHS repeat-associated protein
VLNSPCPGGTLNPIYTYDAENRITSVGGVTYTYDGDGKRVKKSNGTLYWTGVGSDPLAESDLSGNINEEYVFFNGSRLVRVDRPSLTQHYYLPDHLGTASIIATPATFSSATVEESDYLPYGAEIPISGSDPNHYKFTGKERDAESGLDNFGFRYDSSAMGRFMTPDPSRLSVFFTNPQSWNRYSYVYNNPLRLTDDNGKWTKEIHEQIIDNAFPNLTAAQRQILKNISAQQDSILMGGQANSASFEHAMRGPNQTVEQAQGQFNDFVSGTETSAQTAEWTFWLYDPTGGKLALMSGQSLQKAFVALPAGGTAVYTASGLAYYRHVDWLGSSRLATTTNRAVYSDIAYAPYGENYASSGSADFDFTDQNQDVVSGLYDFHFREYHPVQGRWISPDPAGLSTANLFNPQSWNRYTYVGNTPPLSSVDMLGLLEDPGCPPSMGDCGGPGGFGFGGDPNTPGEGPDPFNGQNCTGPCAALLSPVAVWPDDPWGFPGWDREPSLPNFVEDSGAGSGVSITGKIAAAKAVIQNILRGNNDCAKFFNAYAKIFNGHTAVDIFAQTTIETNSNSSFTNVIATSSEGAGASQPITVNANSPFMFPYRAGLFKLGPFISSSPAGNVVALLHEFGHAIYALPPDSQGLDPSGMVSHGNTDTILNNCQSAVQAAISAL